MNSNADRQRIVMLVDNKVEGDSRVQKEARSAAEHGWDVTLLGTSPDARRHEWKLGDATVRLLPLPNARRRHEFRRAPLRSPLAYPEGPISAHVRHKMRSRQSEAYTKRLIVRHRIEHDEISATSALPQLAWAQASRVRAKAYAVWATFRLTRTEKLRERRKRMDSPLDRLTTTLWSKALGHRSWRKLDPQLWSYELAFGPVIDQLQPDLIHANDFRMLGPGARAKLRAHSHGRAIQLVWDSHDYLPGINPWNNHPRWHPAQIGHEIEFAPYADGVVTVSEMMVELLTEGHALTTQPVIVRNAPTVGPEGPDTGTGPGVRELCGLGDEVPLLLYVGTMTAARGVPLMVEALPMLPDVHVAFVVRQNAFVRQLKARADELGVGDRVHLLPYVEVDQICHYIASVDVGVLPLRHLPNHEVDLATKFYEYAQARLPMVVSDVKTSAETARRLGCGEVFVADDLDDYVRAVRAVLADPARYRAAYDQHADEVAGWMWDRQADILAAEYTRLLDAGRAGDGRTGDS